MESQEAIYRAPYAIPELGVEPGDIITVRPAHPDYPLYVARGFDRNRLPAILDHLEGLTLLGVSGAERREEVENAYRLRAMGGRARVPTPSTTPTRGHLALVE